MGEESQVDSNEGSVHSIHARFLLPLISPLPSSLPLTISSFHSQHKQLSLRPWAGWNLCPRRGFLTPPPSPGHHGWTEGRTCRGRSGGTSPCALRILMPGSLGAARDISQGGHQSSPGGPTVSHHEAGLCTVSRGSFPPMAPWGRRRGALGRWCFSFLTELRGENQIFR